MTSTADTELIARYARIPVANIADSQDRFGVPPEIVPAWKGARLAGRAFTVWTRAGDNLVIKDAIEQAQPGDVIVVNGFGDTTRALIGDMIAMWAQRRGIAGFVIDGAVRDIDDLARLGFPVFTRGVSPAGPYKNGPGRLQQPVAISGVVVEPGDIVVGDTDGVVVVRAHDAHRVLEDAEHKLAGEQENRRKHELEIA